jgi:hypothetical protein
MRRRRDCFGSHDEEVSVTKFDRTSDVHSMSRARGRVVSVDLV